MKDSKMHLRNTYYNVQRFLVVQSKLPRCDFMLIFKLSCLSI